MKKKGIYQIIVRTLFWTVGAWAASMLVGGLTALAAAKQWINIQTAQQLVFLQSMIILFVFTVLSVRKLPRSRMPAALGMSLLYILLLLCVGLLGGTGEVSWKVMIPMATSVCAGILSAKNKKRKR